MIQRGLLDRAYTEFTGVDDEFGVIAGIANNEKPWHATWRATGGWIELPNVQSIETAIEFQADSGLADPESATITIDNIIYQETLGASGLFHRIRHGWLSPWRGWTNLGSRQPDPGAPDQNEWFDVLNGGYRVRVWQGYGDELAPVFTGLIDDTDVRATPNEITITCRSFGQVLTDQRVFGSTKAKELRSPIVFADKGKAMLDKTEKVGGGASASTSITGHPAVNVTKLGDDTFWMSHAHTTPDNTEWIQIRLPKGRYREFFVAPDYDGMEMYLSIYARGKGVKGGKCTINGVKVDDGFISRDLGVVPGDNGGHPFVYRWPTVSKGGLRRRLPFTLVCGDDTVLRISFRNLGKHAKNDYRARCSRLLGYRIKQDAEALKKHWILVEDASDVLKWIFMWAGFKTWNVEKMGIRLKDNYTVDQSMFMVDVVKDFLEQADYKFFIEGFQEAEDDIGVPNFVSGGATAPPSPLMEEVRDTDLLEDIDVRFTKEPLAYLIRVRGKTISKAAGGRPLGADPTLRVMADYFPPWSGAHHDVFNGQYSKNYPFAGRLSGVLKHAVYTDTTVDTHDEAMMKCLLAAMRQAIAALGASITIPGHPGVPLNGHISIVDSATGANTKMWVASRQTTFVSGEQTEFKTTVGGAMVDNPDLFMVALDYLYFLDKVQQKYKEAAS